MAVELRTLRVSAEMDAQSFVAGSRAVQAGSAAAGAAVADLSAKTEQSTQKVSLAGNVLERLSRQYVDGYGTAQKFNAAVLQLARSTDTQAVSVDHLEKVYGGMQRRFGLVADGAELASRGYGDLAQAITNVNSKLGAQEAAMTRASAASRQMIAANQNAAHGQNFNAANAAYQFQDIAVTAAMGMNPVMIGLQQGTQLAPLIAQMERPVAGLAAAFGSLVSPVSLVTIGLTAGAAALIQYFSTAESGTEKTSRLFEEQNEIIRAAASAWGAATPQFKAYVDQLERVDRATKGQKASDILAGRELEGLNETLSEIERAGIAAFRSLQGDPNNAVMVRDLRNAWGELRDNIKDGSVVGLDVMRVQRELGDTAAKYGTPQVLAFRDAFDEWTASANRNIQASMKVRQAWIEMMAGGSNVQDIVAGTTFTENGKVYRPSDFQPNVVPVPLRRPAIELEDTQDDQVRRQIDNARRMQEAELRNLSARSPGEKERAARDREQANLVQGETEAARLSRINLAGTRARIEAEYQLSEAQRDRVRSLNESVAGQQFELSLIGKTRGEVVALQTAYQLTSQLREEAARNNVKVDEREIELIQRKASELGRLADLYARAQLQNDLQFERDQLFRSETDRQIASRQKGAGLPVDLSSAEADAIRENFRIAELREGVRGFFTDFRDGLMQGKSWGEALGGAILNALSNALTKTTNSLIESLVNSVVGAGGGKGSNGFDLGSLFTAASGSTASRTAANNNVAGGYSGLAVDRAFSLLGSNESGNASQINSFLKQGGVDIDAAQTAWCAGFVNSALKQVGVDGSGSLVANSFQNWGTSVNPTQALRGDVLLQTRGLGASDPGGHVGFATGASRLLGGKQQLQMLSGNTSDSVNTAWINASELQVRRATEAAISLSGLTSASGVTAQGLGQLGQGFNSFGQNLTSFFPAAPSAPGGGGGLGFFGSLQSLFGPDLSKYTGLTGLFADGTESAPGGLAMVGERGRELINLPKGSQVVPNFRTEQMLSAQNASRSSRRDADGLDVRISFDETGNPIARVEQTARREAKRESAMAVQNFSDKVLPGRMKKINANPRKVG